MPVIPLLRKSILANRIAASNATTTAGRRGIGFLLASPPKPGTPRYKKVQRFYAAVSAVILSIWAGYNFEFDLQFFDEDGKWLMPPLLTIKSPKVQELEKAQKEALSSDEQLLESIKKEFKKD